MLRCVCVAQVLKRRVLFFKWFCLLHVYWRKEVTFLFWQEKSQTPRGEAMAWLPVPGLLRAAMTWVCVLALSLDSQDVFVPTHFYDSLLYSVF